MSTSEKTDIERGWDFASTMIGASISADSAHAYVAKVEEAIEKLQEDLLHINTG